MAGVGRVAMDTQDKGVRARVEEEEVVEFEGGVEA